MARNHSTPSAQNSAHHSTIPDGGAQTFEVALFSCLSNTRGNRAKHTFAELCDLFATCDIRPEKDGPLISFAIYKDGPVYRANENVVASSGLMADCDEVFTLQDLTKRVEELGVKAIIVSSHRHGTPDPENHPDATAPGERYRVIFPLDKLLSAEDYSDAWERMNLFFGGEIDAACKDISRGMYSPSHPTGEGFVFQVFEGRLLSVDDFPSLPPEFHEPIYTSTSSEGEGKGRPGDDYNRNATNADTAQILRAHGWTVTESTSPRWKAKRPGKKGPGISATIGHYGPGILHVFTSSAPPFGARHAYSPFRVFGLLEHGGDFKKAAYELGKNGFGEKSNNFGGFGGFSDFPDLNDEKSGKREGKQANHAQNWGDVPPNDSPSSQTEGNFGVSGGFGSRPEFEKLPQPLGARLRTVQEFRAELLPTPLRASVMDAAKRLSCPPDFVAVPMVISLGALIGRSILIRPKKFDDWAVASNMWGGVIGRPGSKKTPAASEGQRHLNRLQALALAEFEEKEKEASFQNEINEAQRAAIKKKVANAAQKAASRFELEEIRREAESLEDHTPTLRRYVVTDSTVEALGVILSENERGVLQSRDELTGWLNSLDKPGRETDKAFYLQAFNGTERNFIYDRIGRGRLKIPNVCVSIFGTIQPGPLGELIRAASGEKRQRDGFISRFQLLVYPDAIPYKRVDRWPDVEAKNRAFEVFRMLDNITPSLVGAQYDEEDGTHFLRFDDEAQAAFDEWLDRLEGTLASGKETALLEEHFSKYRSLMPSLALIFHLVNIVDGVAAPGPINLRATLQAAAWCQYLESHARRIYGQAFNGDSEALERLGERLPELSNPFSLRDVYKKGWQGLTDKEEVERLLLLLHEAHWVAGRTVPPDSRKAGRPRTMYWINPALLNQSTGGA